MQCGDPARERDACSVGFIVDLKNRPSRKIVESGLSILNNLGHRRAVGAGLAEIAAEIGKITDFGRSEHGTCQHVLHRVMEG